MDTEYYYSPSTNEFYPACLLHQYEKAGTLSYDLTGVSYEVFFEYTQIPPPGKMLIANQDGYPSWGDKPAPTQEELVATADIEKQSRIDAANDYINGKQWPGKAAIGRLAGEELAQYKVWLDYLDALVAVDTSKVPDIIWPDKPE